MRRLARRRAHVAGLATTTLLAGALLAPSAQAAPVPLRSADGFAVLAASSVTNTGPTAVDGELGVSPGTSVTGFPPGTVTNGTIHVDDAVAAQAQSDLTAAFNDAAGRPATATISANLGGTTLAPGVYKSGSTVDLDGDLTLDALGDPDAVFVFQAGSALNVASGARVLLTRGAQACNVFWQVGSSANLGTGSVFAGSILAQASVTVATGARVAGRTLARTGAVTLNANQVSRPACTPPTGTTGTTGSTGSTGSTGTTGSTGAPGTGPITPAGGQPGASSGGGGTAGGASPAGPGGPSSVGAPPVRVTLGSARGSATGRGSSTLRGPRGCVNDAFTVAVSGRGIARVEYSVGGRRVATVGSRDRSGAFRARIRLFGRSTPSRVAARVVYASAARTAARTLRLTVRACANPPRRLPSFTG